MAKARAVVGLYGDPTVSWSIALDVTLRAPIDIDGLRDRVAAVALAHPHLGSAAEVGSFSDEQAPTTLSHLLDTAYGDHDPLVRVTCSEDRKRLMLAAHHGAVDGLGLLAVLGLLLGDPVVSTVHGIGGRSARVGFVRSSAARLLEAIVTPPTRLAPEKARLADDATAAGDVRARIDLPPTRANTARTVAAAAQAIAAWNHRHGSRSNRLVAAIGASRRDGADARPDRDTAYLRLRLPPAPTVEGVHRALATTLPEPTFPERPVGRWALLVTRALRNRLGSTVLVSNLGFVAGPTSISRVAFYPAAAGPRALAVGVASTASYTTVTVRMPRADFTESAANEICTTIADRLA